MNRIYRSIWNEASRTFVAVAEKVRAKGKPASTQRGQAIEEALVTSAGAAAPQAVPPRSRVRPRALEQRFMFDAAAVSTAIDAAGEAVNHEVQADSGLSSVLDKIAQSVAQPRDSERVGEPVLVRTGDPSASGGRKEVAFVDSRVADYQTLIAGIGAGIEVRLIDGSQDGLAQLAAWAASNRDYDAIHILSHGSSGVLALGTATLDLAALEVRSGELEQLGHALRNDGDLLIYGCDVAKGETGLTFVRAIAVATGADVAASDDLTGASRQGGDWVLEGKSGSVETVAIDNHELDTTVLSLQTPDASYVAETADNAGVYGVVGLPDGKVALILTKGLEKEIKIFDKAGVLLNTIDLDALGYQGIAKDRVDFKVTALSNGNLLIAYNANDSSVSSSYYNAKFKIIDQTGAIVQSETQINTTTGSSQTRWLQAVQLDNGNIAFAFQLSTNSHYAVRIFTQAGSAVTSEIRIAGSGQTGDRAGYPRAFDLIALSDGGFVTAWSGDGSSASNSNIMLMKFDASGAVVNQNGASYLKIYSNISNDSSVNLVSLPGGSFSLVTRMYSGSSPVNRVISNDLSNATTASDVNLPVGVSGSDYSFVPILTPGGAGYVFLRVTSPYIGDADYSGSDVAKVTRYSTAGAVTEAERDFASGYSYGIYDADQWYHTESAGASFFMAPGYDRGLIFVSTTTTQANPTDYTTRIQTYEIPASTNVAPTISDVSNQTISEGGATSALAVTIGDTETAASSLTLTGSSSNTTLIPNGNIVISGSGANRTVTITPAANQTGSATITLTVSDGNGGTATDTFTVTVSDVNPVISNATASVDENAGSGTAVTTVTATGDTNGLVYSITGGTGSSLFDINSSTGAITVKNGAVLDYETASQYTLTVAVDDEDADTTADSTATITINLNNLNEAPTNISLSASSLGLSQSSANATVATLSATDPDSGSSHTYSLVAGSGDTHNGSFVINGNTLKVGSSALAAGTYLVRVQATDNGGLTYQKALTVTVSDDVAPTLDAANSTPANNALQIAPSANIVLLFSETLQAGTGTLVLRNVTTGQVVETFNIATGTGNAGGTVSISGSSVTLNPGSNLAEASRYSVRIDATALRDAAANAFVGISDDTSFNFTTGVSDSAAPLIQSIQRQTPAGEASNAASLVYTVRFNEAVTAADSNDFQLTSTGTASGTISSVSGSGTDTLTITVSSVSGTGTLGISLKNTQNITDIAGNALATAEPADDELYVVDRDAPTLLSINRVGGESSQGGSVQFLVVFSEPVSNADVADFALQLGGTASGTISSISGSGTPVLTVTVSNVAGNGALGLGLANGYSISDAVGNALASSTPGTGVAESFVIDSVAPLVSSITRTADSLTTADSVSFDVSFSEATSGVDLGDFSLVTSGTVAGTLSAISGSNGHYRVTVSGISGNGTLGLTFAGGQNITDANGNALTATTPTLGEAYTIDNAAPTVSAINRAGVNQIVAGTSTTAVFTVVFSEVVSGVSAADFTVTGTAANTGISSVSSSDGKTFHVTVGGVNGSSGQTVGLNFSGTVSDRVSQTGSTAFSAGQVYTVGNLLLNEGAIDQAALDALLGVNRDGVQKLVSSSSAPVTQVIIIDSRLPGLAQQLSNLAAGTEVWLLDGKSSATAQITQILAQYHNLAAVHLLSHGSEGALYLGAETLSAANLAAQQTALAAWGSALSASGDFLLYGCDVAKGDQGMAFVNAFAAATQADVAASTDLTGASWLGGDWVLEMKINETVAELNIDGYAKTLAPTVLAAGDIAVVGINTDDSFPNQRWAFVPLVNIAAGTVIHFTDAGYTESGGFYDNATNEGHLTWTVPSEILAGTLITVTGSNIDNYTGETGAIGGSSFTFSSTGDQILVYQGTSGSTNGATFVYAFNNGQHGTVYAAGNGSWSSSVSIQQASLLPSGLVSGTSAVALSSNITSGSSSGGSFGFDNMKYNGIKTGTRAELLAAIGNAANWGW
ncbi:hypothetical protein QF022_001704 [Vogesella perlucida]|nr:hypothetical protein [Vogesella perlucida]